ncbi:hypothetical protein SHIRM173S_02592 [Streptomyces hirsutus]
MYERATELREAGSGLSVMSNAVTALAAFGIDLGLDKRGQAVESFRILDRRGRRIETCRSRKPPIAARPASA